MAIILSAVTNVTISDLPLSVGSSYLSGTTTELLSPVGNFTLEDLRKSADLQTKIDSGDVVLTSDDDYIINVDTIGINFFNTYGGVANGAFNVDGTLTAPIFSGGTFYGDGSNLTGISGIDTFVTGFTLSNSLLSIKQNEGQSDLSITLDANNVDIDSITGLTATTVQEALEEINGNAPKLSWNYGGARKTSSGSDRDMNRDDGVPTVDAPYICPVDCSLEYITASSNGNDTWEAHVYSGGTSIGSVTITAADSGVSSNLGISITAGTKIRLRQVNSTGNVDSPGINAYFKEI